MEGSDMISPPFKPLCSDYNMSVRGKKQDYRKGDLRDAAVGCNP
ncbi:hypothetical protein IBT54_004365 [Pantoea sp. S62]|nr:hypothetical protein [Pantoea sp. S62]